MAFGSDEKLAVHRFRVWQAEQQGADGARSATEVAAMSDAERQRWLSDGSARRQPTDDLTAALIAERERIRDLILTDPKQAAIELRIPELAHRPPKPEKPALTLAELGDFYHANKRNKRGKPLSDKHIRLGKVWWKEFCDCVQVRYVRDITQPMIETYAAHVMSQFDAGMSPTYVKHRFGKVVAVLNFGLAKGKDIAETDRVLKLCKAALVPPADNPVNATPISRADFQALLDQADIRQKAILLTALNFAMKSGEVAELNKADLDLPARTMVSQRGKTGITRVAVIWERTAEAIQAYLKAKPHRGEHLFNSRTGTRLTAKAAGRIVQSLRDEDHANLPDTVNFDCIRDGAYSAAIEAGADLTHAKLLAGHKIGMPDHYIRRNPKMVADCCAAIEAHYFPAPSKPAQPAKEKRARGKNSQKPASPSV